MYNVNLLEPAKELIDSLDTKMKAKTLRTIDLLEEFGPFLKEPHSKKLKSHDIYELRVKFASDILRLFYFFSGNELYVITSGFIKKQNKTNKNEIAKAICIKRTYMEEQHEIV